MKKTILITGGTGYIGSHGVVAFEQAGYNTVIVDNLCNSLVDTLDGIENILGYKPDFFEVDLSKTSPQLSPLEEREQEQVNIIDGKEVKGNFCLDDVFKKYDFDGVIHFAGLKAVGESCDKPLEYFDNNIVGSIRLFEMMEKYSVKNIIFSSSATVYESQEIPCAVSCENKSPHSISGENTSPHSVSPNGREEAAVYSENDRIGNTSNPYGTTKFLLEQILIDLSKFSGFRVSNLRYFNPIGAHSSGFLGEDPEGIPNNLLPYIMKVATGELECLQVFGDDYDTVDGTGVRDYIDVVDLIDGHLKAYEKISPLSISPQGREEAAGGVFEVFNLGVGKGVSVLEMVGVAEKVTGKKIDYKIVGRREGDLGEVYCNPGKALKELGWESNTSLEDSLRNSWGFYSKKI